MPGNEAKGVQHIKYLTRVDSLRTKIIRDMSDYFQTLWLHEIPKEMGCFTQAWGRDEEYSTAKSCKINSRGFLKLLLIFLKENTRWFIALNFCL